MTTWLEAIVSEDTLLHPGHAACAGCAPAINVRHVLDGLAAAKLLEEQPASAWRPAAGDNDRS